MSNRSSGVSRLDGGSGSTDTGSKMLSGSAFTIRRAFGSRDRRRRSIRRSGSGRARRGAGLSALTRRDTVTDLEGPRVLFVADDRKQESLEAFWAVGLSAAQREGIEAIAMDMWEPYVQATLARIPAAQDKIVFDKFHIAKHLNEAVDRVRRAEHRELLVRHDERLVGTKYTWLRNPESFADEAWKAFGPLRRSNLKVARAWALKETIMSLWDYSYVGAARNHFRRWYSWAIRSRLEPIKQKARMLHTRLENVLSYLRHGITNAASEGLNSKIQWIRYTARGFRNRQNFKTAIYFHCGGLDLYPH